ncbi:hypothetical protein [Mesorhizobium sp. M1163]|uniref:hypothetical protein n=1 Tax=Mesorhizobium sp. M1163 TaxID=2957065 RepID=UPI003336AD99
MAGADILGKPGRLRQRQANRDDTLRLAGRLPLRKGPLQSDLSYVAENFDDVAKETIVLVLEAAIAEIIGLRIALQTAASKATWATD